MHRVSKNAKRIQAHSVCIACCVHHVQVQLVEKLTDVTDTTSAAGTKPEWLERIKSTLSSESVPR